MIKEDDREVEVLGLPAPGGGALGGPALVGTNRAQASVPVNVAGALVTANVDRVTSENVKALAAHLAAVAGVSIKVYGSGPWHLEWGDGPTEESMDGQLAREAPGHGVDIDRLHLLRVVQDRAYAVQAVRLILAGELPGRSVAETLRVMHAAVLGTDYPDRPGDDLQERLAGRLVEQASSPRQMAGLLTEHQGLAWLLPEPDPRNHNEALQVLTERYATGDARVAWTQRLQPLPSTVAAEAVDADPDPDTRTLMAALALQPLVRRAAQRRELRLYERLRAANMPWSEISAISGKSPKAMQRRVKRLRESLTANDNQDNPPVQPR